MQDSETKVCQNCKNQFTIEPEDFLFYEKIQVPPPTWCPKCRMQRRLAWFNLFNLYRRKCDLCKEEKISMYPPEAPYRVYCPPCWWSDNWDPLSYGRDYDFSRPFLKQFDELLREVPLLSLSIDLQTMREAPFNNLVGHLRNCYLFFWADMCEDSGYGFFVVHCKSVFDSSLIRLSENCYDSMHAFKDYNCVGVDHTIESLDCFFLKDSANCQNCFVSANLRNKQYYIFNKGYAKDEYFRELKRWDLGSYKTYQEIKKLAQEHWKQFPPKPRWDEMSVNVTGNYVFESKNCKECFEVVGAEDCKRVFIVTDPPVKDCHDISGWGNNLSLAYDCGIVGEDASDLKFCHDSGIGLYHAEYCKQLFGGSYQFGCVSAKKRTYCILNKEYPAGAFEKLREKIIRHMHDMPYIDKKGRVYRYGEFFPVELSPSAYNETVAQSFLPLSKEQALLQGYRWRDEEAKIYTVTKPASELPDHIKDVPDSILNETIGCAACGKGFKIISAELAFLRRMNLPLPRECPLCRIQKKFSQWVKNLRLFKRTCSKCQAEFETSYPQEEVAEILCKKCYLQAVV